MRHPPPDVAEGICYGSSDVPVDATKLDACLATMRARLADRLGDAVPAVMHASPLHRARIAALHLALPYDLPVREDARLAEIHFGEWEMQPWQDVVRAELERWAEDPEHGGAPGGESAAQVASRLAAWLAATRAAGESAESGGPHVVVAHAGPIRLLTAHVLGLPVLGCLRWPIAFGGLCRVTIGADGRGQLVHWNV
ncbi:Glucosyl-3-phosphoglycerate phosphatase [Pandoraea terrae]|uniref:Glucosyl-3-phosphoglycerate phosphatase n=2 Tax=Pandoraea terrae TaxID=1537710 RepID=A0A5E4RMY5_9BURK|nr:Glucosyl-3-phosphoglycerate phosphatase [Pandoraea terrae]